MALGSHFDAIDWCQYLNKVTWVAFSKLASQSNLLVGLLRALRVAFLIISKAGTSLPALNSLFSASKCENHPRSTSETNEEQLVHSQSEH